VPEAGLGVGWGGEEMKSNDPIWRAKYREVVNSSRWKKLRQKFIERQDSKCLRCGWCKVAWDKSRNLELHHKTYDRLGEERESDLELVCSVCHELADVQRARESRKRAENKLYDAQFYGWASKVYGDDFQEDEDMHDRFIDWKERKDR
jgi:5-methylcytosine-specific restriction endonuclease McrA